MEWVFLAVSINGAAYTLNAYMPVKRNPLLFGWSFFASWITIELAWAHLVIQVVATALFARKGVLRTKPGKFALALNLASWAGLGFLVWRALGARAEIRSAFADLAAEERAPQRLPVKRTRNITYTTAGGKALKLDVTQPTMPVEPGQRRPAILQIHGGGWVIGDKREQGLPLLRYLASQGWVGFNANYRLSPKATFPDMLVDLKHAVAWIREHADEYGVDPDFIAVTGGSAGGHLTALMALTQNDPRYQPGFEDADTSLQAAVPFYGVYDFTNRNRYYDQKVVDTLFGRIVLKAKFDEEPERFSEASPQDHVRADAPPFLVIHGDKDTLAPVEGARDFVADLREVSDAPVLYLELKNAQHAFEIFPSIRANQVVRAAERFLNDVHRAYLAGIEPADVSEGALAKAVDDVTPDAESVTA
jgi:acetyl esterase/lipase